MNQYGYPQPGQVITYRCGGCGAPLPININQQIIYCQHCGTANQIPQQAMNTTINYSGVQINAQTDTESILRSAEYLITCNQHEKAKDTLFTAIMSGADDYRIYLLKVKLDMWADEDMITFTDLDKLKTYEASNQNSDGTITRAICELMHYRGMNGITLLHLAAYQVMFDQVVYCVDHQSDVNSIAGSNQVTPISIMFRPENARLQNNKAGVKAIRDYLMAHGARDFKRRGF